MDIDDYLAPAGDDNQAYAEQNPSSGGVNPQEFLQGATNGVSVEDAGIVQTPMPVTQTQEPAPEPAQQQAPAAPAPSPQGGDQTDYQRQLQALQAENERLKSYEQLGQMVENDQDLYQHMASYFEGGATPEPEEPALERPTLPEDPYDQEAFRKYNEDLLTYNEALAEQKARSIASEQVQAFQQQLYAQQQAERQQAMMQNQLSQVRQKYGVDEQNFQQFQQWASDPRNVSPENVFKLYQIVTGAASAQAPTTPQAVQPGFNQPMGNTSQPMRPAPRYPQPLATAGGNGQSAPQGPKSFSDFFQMTQQTGGDDFLL